MLEKFIGHHAEVPDKYIDPAASTQLTTYDYVVRVSASSAITLTLPPVAEAIGRTYTIIVALASFTNTVTVADKDDSEGWVDIVLTNAGQVLTLYSNGTKWFVNTNDQIVTYKRTLTNAQIKALRATPITVAPAPGAGRVNILQHAVLYLDYGGTNVFTESADNLVIKLTDGSGAAVSSVIECTNFIDQSADTMTRTNGVIDAIATLAAYTNAPLVIQNNGDGEFAGNAGADNTIVIYTTVRILTL